MKDTSSTASLLRPIRPPAFLLGCNSEAPPFTIGGRWLYRRHRVPRDLANTVAELAGIGREPTL